MIVYITGYVWIGPNGNVGVQTYSAGCHCVDNEESFRKIKNKS